MAEIKKTALPLEQTSNSKSVVGQKVLTKDGQEIGKISAVRLHPRTLQVEGVIVDKGLFKDNYYIGRDYIETLNEEGAMLNIVPSEEFAGKDVYDIDGEKVAKVREVKRIGPTNELLSLVCDKLIGSGEELVVNDEDIKEIGENIVLNAKVET